MLFIIAAAISIAYIDPISSKFKEATLASINYFKKNQANQKNQIAKIEKDNTYSKEIINQILQQQYMFAMSQQANRNNEGNDAESQEMIEEALNSLHNNKDELERELAVLTLGEYTSDKAREGILFALKDPENVVREQAVVQISEWGDLKERQKMILSALNNDNTDIIIVVLESISEVDDPLLIKRLNVLSKDRNEQIREAAQLALALVEDN